jgi:hypothetical protein
MGIFGYAPYFTTYAKVKRRGNPHGACARPGSSCRRHRGIAPKRRTLEPVRVLAPHRWDAWEGKLFRFCKPCYRYLSSGMCSSQYQTAKEFPMNIKPL